MIRERQRIKDIVNELMYNAMRAHATKIAVTIEDLETAVRITVEDNGCGMPPEKAARLRAILNRERRDELEMLAGAAANRTGLMMVGIMSDKAQLESAPGEGTKVVIYRNKAGV